jgi:hypothetical protein
MNNKTIMITAALVGLWIWHKKRGIATPATASTGTAAPSTAPDAEGWMGAWGIGK